MSAHDALLPYIFISCFSSDRVQRFNTFTGASGFVIGLLVVVIVAGGAVIFVSVTNLFSCFWVSKDNDSRWLFSHTVSGKPDASLMLMIDVVVSCSCVFSVFTSCNAFISVGSSFCFLLNMVLSFFSIGRSCA